MYLKDNDQDREIDNQIQKTINKRYQEENRDSINKRIDEFEFDSLIKNNNRTIHVRNVDDSLNSEDDLKFLSEMSINTSDNKNKKYR